ncbi:MAG: hypothetical protein OXC26_21965 [Albidovulum sp.]|nr:hypothetical protein [Albidovulum sp.]
MRKQEVAARAGKQEDGSAKTREVKVAAFFNFGPPEKKTGNAQRDPDSVSVAAAIESAAGGEPSPFALSDGGARIWSTVDDLVPGAVQILDLCHVLKRLSDVAKALAKRWRGMVRSERLQPVVEELKSHATRHEKAGETVACFESNRSKMDHPRYRDSGLPVGSGVIEGACRSVVCERLKISGRIGRRRKKRSKELI